MDVFKLNSGINIVYNYKCVCIGTKITDNNFDKLKIVKNVWRWKMNCGLKGELALLLIT